MTGEFRVWLFDIDGTLIDTAGAGLAALKGAAESHFGGPSPDLDLRGATDLGVLADLRGHYSAVAGEDDTERFFADYHERLRQNLDCEEYAPQLLPGVEGLLARLGSDKELHVGLLTGNTEAGAATKTRRFGLHQHFAFGAYGSDHADRNELGPIALARASRIAGKELSGSDAVVIGDTPRDVDCAKAIGAWSIGVTTGSYTRAELETAGADRVVSDLREI